MEDAAARARRYEKALEMIWGPHPRQDRRDVPSQRDIAAVALGLRAPGMHLRGIDHLAPPRPPK